MANDTKIKKWLLKKRKKEMVFKQRSNHGPCQKKTVKEAKNMAIKILCEDLRKMKDSASDQRTLMSLRALASQIRSIKHEVS